MAEKNKLPAVAHVAITPIAVSSICPDCGGVTTGKLAFCMHEGALVVYIVDRLEDLHPLGRLDAAGIPDRELGRRQ